MKKLVSMTLAVIMFVSLGLSAFALDPGSSFDLETNTDTLLLVNADTDEVIYSKNTDVKRPMASTTKIMTYIVVAETLDDLVNTKIEIKQEPIDDVLNQDASMAGFQDRVGESFSVLDILYGLMLPSGCDAAEILAYYIGDGDVGKFVDMMNQKALELGCENTHFNDAHGLSSENHYTTAEDLYKISKYALKMPYFTDIVKTEYYTLPGSNVPMINTNYLIDNVNGGRYYYQYATGIKTGYTEEAGKCLVSTASKGDTNLMCIALGARYDTGINYAMIDSVNLYKWAFENFTENTDISLDCKYKSVQIGEQVHLNAEITSGDKSSDIKWSSSDTDVATVDENGNVTAVSMGEAYIKAETATGNFAVCTLSCGYYNGIDVNSGYGNFINGEKEPIDWKAVKDYGFDFAIIRAGWGWEDYPNQNDKSFAENVKGAVENGIPFGIKFISYATDKETARLEAEYLLKEIEDYIPEYKKFIALPVSYDIHDDNYLNFTPEQVTEIALEFNRVMNENGYKTMCYANKSVFANMNVSALKEAGMGLWYAYYPYKADFSEKIKINDQFVPDVWQYRTDGYVPEASNNLYTNQNVIYMLTSEFEKYQAPEVTAKQIKDEKSVEISWEKVQYNADGYTVYRKTDSGDLQKLADLAPDNLEYIDNNLEWGDEYTYCVAAKVTDFLDKNYVKEIMGVCDSPVKIINSSEETTEPSYDSEPESSKTEESENESTSVSDPETESKPEETTEPSYDSESESSQTDVSENESTSQNSKTDGTSKDGLTESSKMNDTSIVSSASITAAVVTSNNNSTNNVVNNTVKDDIYVGTGSDSDSYLFFALVLILLSSTVVCVFSRKKQKTK